MLIKRAALLKAENMIFAPGITTCVDNGINAAEKIERQKIEESVHDTASNEAVTKAVKEKRNSDAVQEIEVREGKFLLPQIVEASIKPFYGR